MSLSNSILNFFGWKKGITAYIFYYTIGCCFGLYGAPLTDSLWLSAQNWDDEPIKDRCQFELTSAVNWSKLNSPCRRDDKFKENFLSIQSFRIVIDPGHGGRDRGAQGHLGISEKWLALEGCRILRSELEAGARELGIEVKIQMTREEDAFQTLHERVAFANDWGADVFVSLHANWSPVERARGFEVYFLSQEASDAEARRLVQIENKTREIAIKSDILNILTDVQTTKHIEESSDLAERVFNRLSMVHLPNGPGVRQGPFTVLSGTSMPSVLIELGFVSNTNDATLLRNQAYLRSLSHAISNGILDFVVRSRKSQTS